MAETPIRLEFFTEYATDTFKQAILDEGGLASYVQKNACSGCVFRSKECEGARGMPAQAIAQPDLANHIG